MERIFAATEDGYYWLPKEATTGNPLLSKKIEAMIPSVKSDAAGSHHQEMTTPDGLPEHRVGATGALPVVEAREPMHDDSGAQTGLRRRPDYGESDSLTSTLNRGNAKGASYQYVIAIAAHSKKEASKKATMYVSHIEWQAGDCLKVAKFAYSRDPQKAVRLGNLTANAVVKQLNSPKFGVKSHIHPVTASFQTR